MPPARRFSGRRSAPTYPSSPTRTPGSLSWTRRTPALPPPDITIDDRLSLVLGEREVSLRYPGRSHSDDMVVHLGYADWFR